MERERQKQDTYRAMKAAAGQKGGRPKADRKQNGNRRQANESPPSSSSSPISDLHSPKKKELTSADADFEAFRQAYPASRRVGGKAAKTAWANAMCVNPARHPLSRAGRIAEIMPALEQHKRSEQWQTPKLIPLMTTWLNQERWLQVLPEPKAEPVPYECPHDPPCFDGQFRCRQRTQLAEFRKVESA